MTPGFFSEWILTNTTPVQSGTEMNIAFGDTPPEDTSKLWVKTTKPAAVEVKLNADFVGSGELKAGILALPSYRYEMAAAAVGDKIYVFGGRTETNSSSSAFSSDIILFDTKTNTITTLTQKLDVGLAEAAIAAVGTKIYLFGGYYYRSTGIGYRSHIIIFDTETHTRTTSSTFLPSSCADMSAAAVGNDIYLFGGRSNGSHSSYIYVFHTKSDSLERVPVYLPTARAGSGIATVGHKIYVIGGSKGTVDYLYDIIMYDTEKGTITTLAPKLSSSQIYSEAASVGTKIYIFGGSNTNKIFELDTETNKLTQLYTILPANIYSEGIAAVGNKIYLLGGYASGMTKSIHEFVALMDLPKNHILIEASGSKNIFNLLPNMEIGVKNVYLGNADGLGERVPAYLHHTYTGVDYTYYYTSSVAELTEGTELTSSVSCNVGDLVVAAIATRDTLTLSDGWTLISTSEVNSTDTTNGQRLSWAWKIAESTTESITVTQATAQRLYINMVALPGATGVTDNGYSYADSNVANITVTKPEGLVLWGMTAPTWTTTAPYNGWTISNDSPIIELPNTTPQRLGIGLDQSTDESVTITPEAAATMIIGCLTVQGLEKFYDADPYERPQWDEI
jgi:N-acetylneuraminic acid mutarotase